MARSRRGRGGRTQQQRDAQEMTWFRMDLHIHTPASADYQDLDATYLHILQKAEGRGLDIVAFTDHNTVSGIATMRREIEDLELLEQLGRLNTEEYKLLEEYRRVLTNVLVLPGFEFTAAFGFHILGIFPPEATVRKLEHILMLLNVPEEQIELGSNQVGATADVLTAYEVINEHGGLVIPAHVNAAHGVSMPGFRFGGQTKIAYTQSEYLHALEVTDLDDMSRRSTAAFFNGSKPEYPRRMHVIQGSDAHRISREGARRDTDLGIGDRATEVLLPTRTFAALKELFESDDFARTRPYQPVAATPYDPIQAAREQGPTILQTFHEQVRSRRSRYRPILKDIVAFANTNGGTIYVGMSASPQQPVIGVPSVEDAARGLREAISRSVVPSLDITVDIEASGGKPVLVVSVPKGLNTPYATDAGQVFVRQEGQTVIALRDEIVQLVREAAASEPTPYAGGTEQDRVWSAPRTVTDIEEDGEEIEEPPEAAAEPVLTAHIVEPEPESLPEPAPQPRESRRPRRRRPRARTETPSETPADSQPDAEDVARVTAALDLAAGLPTEADSVTETPTEAETPAELPTTPEPAADEHTAAATVEAPPTAEKRPRRRTRKPKAAGGEDADSTAHAAGRGEEGGRRQAAGGSEEDDGAQPSAGEVVGEHAQHPAPSTQHSQSDATPRSGVEIVAEEVRDGERRYTMRDLGSGRTLENVTRKTARRLWRQALLAREEGLVRPETIQWQGNLGLAGSAMRDGVRRYNLAWKADDGAIRYFYAVSDDGITESWRALISSVT